LASVKPPVGSVKLNACPTIPGAEVSVPLNTGAVLAFTVRLNELLADAFPVSVAVSVTELVPDADGVPAMVPFPELMLNPAGKPVAV